MREGALLAVLCVPLLLVLAALLWRSGLTISLNANEGWNAYWASAAAHGDRLYPAPWDLRTNNYPPLSFILVGLMTKAGAGPIMAGRVIAWISFLSVAALIGRILRQMGNDRIAAATGSILFLAFVATQYTNYVGVDDPQMLAHAVMCGALLMLVGNPDDRRLFFAALLMAAGLFIKHNLIALPIAATLWLATSNRRHAAIFAGTLAMAGLTGLVLCRIAYGPDFVSSLLSPRVTSFERAHRLLEIWLAPMLIPLGLTAALTTVPLRDRYVSFIVIYAGTALLVGALSATGDGVSYSCMFELVIAFSLGTGHLLGRLRAAGAPEPLRLYAMVALGASSLFWASTQIPHDVLRVRPWIRDERAEAVLTRETVERIAERPRPALCQTLAVCYWAGKPFAADIFSINEAIHRGQKSADVLATPIAARLFSSVQIDPDGGYSYVMLPSEALAALRRNYRLDAVGAGEVYVPR
ncbi:MAG: glycosyltransferase family 39 protein [Alphaproteobacteria bacterium]|nr:glycosyltransferase family 39 protein [Alphaproteobacteria bacterium]